MSEVIYLLHCDGPPTVDYYCSDCDSLTDGFSICLKCNPHTYEVYKMKDDSLSDTDYYNDVTRYSYNNTREGMHARAKEQHIKAWSLGCSCQECNKAFEAVLHKPDINNVTGHPQPCVCGLCNSVGKLTAQHTVERTIQVETQHDAEGATVGGPYNDEEKAKRRIRDLKRKEAATETGVKADGDIGTECLTAQVASELHQELAMYEAGEPPHPVFDTPYRPCGVYPHVSKHAYRR